MSELDLLLHYLYLILTDMDDKLRILLCEDDENLGMLLREYLQAKGYIADLFPDGDAGYKAFLKTKYDICVFDVMMPKKDGFTLAKEVRSANSEVPIIFLTAKTLKEDILEGFKIGADDYITKPFSMEELTLRVEAILRRVRGKRNKDNNTFKIGKFTFDIQKQILSIDGEQTKLTTKESELLNLLCTHANDVLNRDFLHLELTYGRYLASCTWFEALTGKSVVGNGYHPDTVAEERAKLCQEIAHGANRHPFQLTGR